MIIIDQTVVSDEVADQHFVCDLAKCKGACCEEGDLGAPLSPEECSLLEQEIEAIKPFLTPAGLAELDKQGLYILDEDGDFSTPTLNGRECAYAIREKNGHLKCGIEMAWKAGKTQWRKPISCHLYPIRVTKYPHYEAVNYHKWHICRPACHNGKALQVPLYKFLKDPLITRFGEEWYNALVQAIEAQHHEQPTP